MAWELERDIISAGYRQLAKKMHPDKGGTAAGMVRLNAARDRLKAMLAWGEGQRPGIAPQETAGVTTPQPPANAPQPYKPMAPSEFLQYVRTEMNKDPLSAGILTLVENFVTRKAGRSTDRHRGAKR